MTPLTARRDQRRVGCFMKPLPAKPTDKFQPGQRVTWDSGMGVWVGEVLGYAYRQIEACGMKYPGEVWIRGDHLKSSPIKIKESVLSHVALEKKS